MPSAPPTAPPAAEPEKTPPSEVPKVDVVPLSADEDIALRLRQILESTHWFAAPQVRANHGVVFLSGATSDTKFKEWAGKLAERTQDVVAVVNQIEVEKSSIWDISPAIDQLRELSRSAIQTAPLLFIGMLIFLLAWLATRATAHAARRVFSRRMSNELLRDVAAKAAAVPVFLLGLYLVLQVSGLTRLALTLLGGTGIAGIVIGIAFRDIVENFLASLLVSLQRPFRVGDVIKVDQYRGVVQKVTARGTLLMDFDGTFVQIPNATIYKSVILNYTANNKTRQDFVVTVDHAAHLTQAQELVQATLNGHPAVLADPEPLVLVEKLRASGAELHIYFWVNGNEHSPPRVLSALLRLVKRAFEEADIGPVGRVHRLQIARDGRSRTKPPSMPADRRAGGTAREGAREAASADQAAVATPAEGSLKTEAEEIKSQAAEARKPEGGANLLPPADDAAPSTADSNGDHAAPSPDTAATH